MSIIAGLACVDGVFLEESLAQKAEYLWGYSADILVMGDDWAGKFDDFSCICGGGLFSPYAVGIDDGDH